MELEDRWGIPIHEIEANKSAYDLAERMVYDNRIRVSELAILSAQLRYVMICMWGDPKKSKPKFEDLLPHPEKQSNGQSFRGAAREAAEMMKHLGILKGAKGAS